jgi:hypothetical protein
MGANGQAYVLFILQSSHDLVAIQAASNHSLQRELQRAECGKGNTGINIRPLTRSANDRVFTSV